MLSLSAVRKSYDGRVVLRSTDLTIATGRTTVLIGPSGSGKSTLLRIMIGLITPDEGTVRLGETLLDAKNVAQLRQRMGYVIQDGGLFPHLTAEQNVTLMARHLRKDRDWIAQRLGELAALTHFPRDGLKRYPLQLSGGQRQRVSLMRALMLDPEVLLLDEPLGALDPIIRAELQSELRDVFSQLHKTVVLVTHDIAEAAYFSTADGHAGTIVLLRNGNIVQKGEVADLVHHPAEPFVREFIHAQRAAWDSLEGRPQ